MVKAKEKTVGKKGLATKKKVIKAKELQNIAKEETVQKKGKKEVIKAKKEAVEQTGITDVIKAKEEAVEETEITDIVEVKEEAVEETGITDVVEAKDEGVEETGMTKVIKAKKEKLIWQKEITIKKKVAKEAISVLKKLNQKFSEGKLKKPLFDDNAENHIYLQVTLKKIPPKKLKRLIKVRLPHSLLTETTEVCLITGDLDKRDSKAEIEPTIQHYKELLNKHGVTGIAEVVPVRQLRTEYKTYESKRQLSAAYDIFLNDKKITGVLPNILGKAFYDKRKFPVQINLDASNLKEQFEKALSEIVFPISCHGTSCTSEVARISMDDNAILENILTCVKCLQAKVPGKGTNIMGLYIKTAKSEAIPIFMSFEDSNELKIKAYRRHERVKAEELSTVKDAEVKVFKDGRISVTTVPLSEDENSADEAEEKSGEEIQINEEDGDESHSDEENEVNEEGVENGEKSEDNEENGEESEDNEENGLVTKANASKSKKRKIELEDNSIKTGEIKPKVGKQKRRQNDKKVKDVVLDTAQEAASNINGKNLKAKRNKVGKIKDILVSETNTEDFIRDIEEEPEVNIGSSVQKNSKKRKSSRQSNKGGTVADLNVIKKRRSQGASAVVVADDNLETEVQEETKIHVTSPAQNKTPKRKSRKLNN